VFLVDEQKLVSNQLHHPPTTHPHSSLQHPLLTYFFSPINNHKKHKIKRGAGAKHSDINIYAFYQRLPPECYCPYRIEKKQQLTHFTHQ
jgi:hypothetical protein